jgi:hypothetical protein
MWLAEFDRMRIGARDAVEWIKKQTYWAGSMINWNVPTDMEQLTLLLSRAGVDPETAAEVQQSAAQAWNEIAATTERRYDQETETWRMYDKDPHTIRDMDMLPLTIRHYMLLATSEEWVMRHDALNYREPRPFYWETDHGRFVRTYGDEPTPPKANDPWGSKWAPYGATTTAGMHGKGRACSDATYRDERQVWPGYPHNLVVPNVWWNHLTDEYWTYVTPTYWWNWKDGIRSPCTIGQHDHNNPHRKEVRPGENCPHQESCAYWHKGEGSSKWMKTTARKLCRDNAQFHERHRKGQLPTGRNLPPIIGDDPDGSHERPTGRPAGAGRRT